MISISYTSKPNNFHNHHYIIVQNLCSFGAYDTDKGFYDFIARHNIELTEVEPMSVMPNGAIRRSYIDKNKTIENKYFWALDELPSDAKQYTGLSNGSLVDCYYTEDCIYRPNPNAKEVYNPLPISEHIAFMRING